MGRIEAVKTPLEFRQIARALLAAWERLERVRPSPESLALLLAQSALETGHWKKAYCYNLGNAKAGESWQGDHCYYFADEIVNASQAAQAYGQKAPRTDGSAAHNVELSPVAGGKVKVTLWPDHPWCRFRAFGSLEKGADDYLGLLRRRFAVAWPALEQGDPETFVTALKHAGYFTASLAVYLPPVLQLFEKFSKALLADEALFALPALPLPVGVRPTVKRGAEGAFVLEIQTILIGAGYADVELDGDFDEQLHRAVKLFQLQHVDAKGLPLVSDGEVGKRTWWALLNNSGHAQRNHLPPPTAAELTPTRSKLVELLVAEHAKGVREVPDGSNDSPEIRKYWGKTGVKKKPWCCAFVSWALQETVGAPPIGGVHHLGVQLMWVTAKKLGMETKTPKPGDVFVQIKNAGMGHTGFVVSVSRDGQTIYTCEGNCGNRLKLGRRERSTINYFIDAIADGQGQDFPRASNLTFEDVDDAGTR